MPGSHGGNFPLRDIITGLRVRLPTTALESYRDDRKVFGESREEAILRDSTCLRYVMGNIYIYIFRLVRLFGPRTGKTFASDAGVPCESRQVSRFRRQPKNKLGSK